MIVAMMTAVMIIAIMKVVMSIVAMNSDDGNGESSDRDSNSNDDIDRTRACDHFDNNIDNDETDKGYLPKRNSTSASVSQEECLNSCPVVWTHRTA